MELAGRCDHERRQTCPALFVWVPGVAISSVPLYTIYPPRDRASVPHPGVRPCPAFLGRFPYLLQEVEVLLASLTTVPRACLVVLFYLYSFFPGAKHCDCVDGRPVPGGHVRAGIVKVPGAGVQKGWRHVLSGSGLHGQDQVSEKGLSVAFKKSRRGACFLLKKNVFFTGAWDVVVKGLSSTRIRRVLVERCATAWRPDFDYCPTNALYRA